MLTATDAERERRREEEEEGAAALVKARETGLKEGRRWELQPAA